MKHPEVTNRHREDAIQRLSQGLEAEAYMLRSTWVDYCTWPNWQRPGHINFTIEAIKNTALAIAYEAKDEPSSSKQEVLSQLLRKAGKVKDEDEDETPRRRPFQVIEDFLLRELSGDTDV